MSVAVPYPGMSAIPGRHPLSWDTCVPGHPRSILGHMCPGQPRPRPRTQVSRTAPDSRYPGDVLGHRVS